MIRRVKMRDRIIGKSFLTLFIAEMACAHQDNILNAIDLVKVGAEADIDTLQLYIYKKE